MSVETLKIEGALNFASMPFALAATEEYAGRAALPDCLSIDLSHATEIDSSAVALLLHWRREAAKLSKSLRYINLPESLQALATLYGVEGLIHCPMAAQNGDAANAAIDGHLGQSATDAVQ